MSLLTESTCSIAPRRRRRKKRGTADRSTITVDECLGEARLQGHEGSPVIDLKPTMAEFRAVRTEQPDWVTRMMSEYFKP